MFDNASGWDYNAKMWQQHFADDPVVANDLSKIVEKCPTRISRSDVRYFASKAGSGGYEDLRTLFLACMIWGYGNNANGLVNTRLSLFDPKAAREVLETTARQINRGQVFDAYKGFRLQRCGSAFFTKFFYFVGQERRIEPLPLILDSHVANFLEFLGKDERDKGREGWHISVFVKVGSRKESGAVSTVQRYEQGYMQYLNSANDWAEELGCPAADNIEYFMYLKDKQQSKRARNRKEEQMGQKAKRARNVEKDYVKQARQFSKENGMTGEMTIIDDMECPSAWNLPKKGEDGKPYWYFHWAIVGNCLLMWEHKGMSTTPEAWTSRCASDSAKENRKNEFREYLKTAEGKAWQQNHQPDWLPQSMPTGGKTGLPQVLTLESIEVCLPKNRMEQLHKLANESNSKPEDTARAWIVERLVSIYRD